MDGTTLLRHLRQLLDETSSSGFLDTLTSYDFLYEAVQAFCERTLITRARQQITITAGVDTYNLNGDYLKLFAKDRNDRFFIRFLTSTTTYFPLFRDFGDILKSNMSTFTTSPSSTQGAFGSSPFGSGGFGGGAAGSPSVSTTQQQEVPDNFTIMTDSSIVTRLTGATNQVGTLTYGESKLIAAQDFSSVTPGDIVHNVTDGSDGVVIANVSYGVLNTVLFGGTNNYWSLGDSFVIQPSTRYKLVLYPIPSVSSDLAIVDYVSRPTPVYSQYGTYSIPSKYFPAIEKYAAFLYKYKDRAPNFGDAWYKFWEDEVRKAYDAVNGSMVRGGRLHVSYQADRHGHR